MNGSYKLSIGLTLAPQSSPGNPDKDTGIVREFE